MFRKLLPLFFLGSLLTALLSACTVEDSPRTYLVPGGVVQESSGAHGTAVGVYDGSVIAGMMEEQAGQQP